MKINWDFEEAVALVNLYFKIESSPSNSEMQIQRFHEILLNRAKLLGSITDDKYRNITGIKMKLQNIRFIVSEENTGLSSYSKIDELAIELFKEKKVIFDYILDEFERKYS